MEQVVYLADRAIAETAPALQRNRLIDIRLPGGTISRRR